MEGLVRKKRELSFEFRYLTNSSHHHTLTQMGMKATVPFVQDITAGKNTTERSRGFTHAIVVTLAKADDLPLYDAHEGHQRVVRELIRPSLEEVMALDYTAGAF